MRGVLPSTSPLARLPFGGTSRGSLSRSVRRDMLVRFPVPQGTLECFGQDVQRGIVISVQHDPTTGTKVGPHTQRLLDQCSTCATLLAAELWCDGDHRDLMHPSIGFHPGEELSPTSIVN